MALGNIVYLDQNNVPPGFQTTYTVNVSPWHGRSKHFQLEFGHFAVPASILRAPGSARIAARQRGSTLCAYTARL